MQTPNLLFKELKLNKEESKQRLSLISKAYKLPMIRRKLVISELNKATTITKIGTDTFVWLIEQKTMLPFEK